MKRSYASAATAKLIACGLYAARVFGFRLAVPLVLALALLPGARGSAESLTLEQQVGQLIVFSFRGTVPPAYVLQTLRQKRAAGVILFGGNVASPEQVRSLTRALRRQGGRPIVAIDQEGGQV